MQFKGYTHFEFSHYFGWYVLPWLVNVVLYAVLAVFIQTLVPHKFVGLLVMLLFIVAQMTLPGSASSTTSISTRHAERSAVRHERPG